MRFSGIINLRMMDLICRLRHKCDRVFLRIKPLYGGIIITDHYNSYFPALDLLLPPYNDNITVIDARSVHAVPRYPEREVFCTSSFCALIAHGTRYFPTDSGGAGIPHCWNCRISSQIPLDEWLVKQRQMPVRFQIAYSRNGVPSYPGKK